MNWAGRLVVGLVFVLGVALSAYGGVLLGSLVGLERGMPHLTAPPTKGVGLAPDLSGLGHAAVEFGISLILVLLVSLVAGVTFSATACVFLLAPVLRRIRGFTTQSRI